MASKASEAIKMPKMLLKSMKNRKSLRKRFRNRRSKVGIVGLWPIRAV